MDMTPNLYIEDYRSDGIFIPDSVIDQYVISIGTASAGDLRVPAADAALVSDASFNIEMAGPLVLHYTMAGGENVEGGDLWVPAADLAAFRVASIPLAAMPTLSAAEATAAAYPGDIRKILYALAELIYSVVTSTAWTGSETPAEKFTATRSTGESGGLAIRDYLIRAFLTTGYEVQDE